MIEKKTLFGSLCGRYRFALLFAMFAAAALNVSRAAEISPFLPSDIRIVTANGPVSMSVELAATPEARAQGLQGRRFLAPDSGMLFDFGRSKIITMWMKNTFIPLDMIFIAADGRIVHIARNTEPFSLETIRSPVPASAVLELMAGAARRLGIEPGDRVEHGIFKRSRL